MAFERFIGPCLAIVAVQVASAATVTLLPSKDNTLIQWSEEAPGANPLLSNGLGDIYTGRTNQDGQEQATMSIRRGLVHFDVGGAIPSGMTIVSATLTMRDERGRNGDPAVRLHRVLQDWGEGTSFFQGGQGAPATDGDATWFHTFYNAADPQSSPTWSNPGGNYSPTTSAEVIVTDDLGGGQLFSWSGAGMVADLQGWLAAPASNFGWMLIGDESRGQSAKRLNSRESTEPPNVPPTLVVEYAFAGDYNDDGLVDAADYIVWRKWSGSAATLPNETETPGEVTAEDFGVWKTHFGTTRENHGTQAITTVPEPGCGMLVFLGLGGIYLVWPRLAMK